MCVFRATHNKRPNSSSCMLPNMFVHLIRSTNNISDFEVDELKMNH